MNLYVAERTGTVGYDEFYAFAVVAKDMKEAKALIKERLRGSDNCLYCDIEHVLDNWKIKKVRLDTVKPSILCAEFNAG